MYVCAAGGLLAVLGVCGSGEWCVGGGGAVEWSGYLLASFSAAAPALLRLRPDRAGVTGWLLSGKH